MSTCNRYVDIITGVPEKMEVKEIKFNVLNDILNRMEVKQITFGVISLMNNNEEDLITLEFIDTMFNDITYNRKYYWKDIDSMFNDIKLNISDVVNFIKMESSTYSVLDCNTMKFLEIIAGCHSLEELLLKIQLMGY